MALLPNIVRIVASSGRELQNLLKRGEYCLYSIAPARKRSEFHVHLQNHSHCTLTPSFKAENPTPLFLNLIIPHFRIFAYERFSMLSL